MWDGEIEYSRTFSVQDKNNDIAMLKMAKDSNIENPAIKAEIDKMIYEVIKGEPYEESLEIEEEKEEESVTAIAQPTAIIAAPVAEADDDAQE